MGSDKGTTRRNFVIGALVGVPSAALLSCGGKSETTDNTRPGGAAGGGAGGDAGVSGESGSGGAGGESGSGGAGGTNSGGASGDGGTSSGGTNGSGAVGGASGSAGTAGAGGTSGAAGSAGMGGTAADAGTCTLYPLQTEGPYYLDLDRLRTDITEGKAGEALTVVIRVLRASDCTPLRDVAVDLWQCDAAGVYGGFPGQLGGLDTTGQTFLRGTQVTGADGEATFETIYPGWYPGRTTHIHFKVHPSSTTEATSQMYFPEDVTAQIYTTGVYAARGQKDTTNAVDGVNRGVAPLATVTRAEGRYHALLVVAVAG